MADAREESTAGFGSGIAYDYDSKYRVFLGGGDGKVRRDSIGEIAIQKNTLTFRPRALIESERVALVPPFKGLRILQGLERQSRGHGRVGGPSGPVDGRMTIEKT